MNPGDRVIICDRHWKWLLQAGKVRDMMLRYQNVGIILELLDDGLIKVQWRQHTLTHFIENLETI